MEKDKVNNEVMCFYFDKGSLQVIDDAKDLKAAVNTVRILSKSCMFFWVFRFAKNTNFLLKGGIHLFSMRIFRVQFRFSQVPRLVEFLDRKYFVQTPAESNAHAQLCYQGLCQPPRYL